MKWVNHWQCVLNKQINLAQRLGLSLKRVDAAAVTEQTQSSSEASDPSNCFSHHLGSGVGPGPALHSAETKQKTQRNGWWSRHCLSVEWKRTKRKSGFTAASSAHSEAGQISGIFHPLDSPPQKAFVLQAAWGSEAPDPYGNEQREKERQAFYRKSCQQGSGCCSPSNDLITRKAGEQKQKHVWL